MGYTRKIGYVCAGVGLGSALGVLLAPQSGVQTRDHLREIAERGSDRLKAGARDIRHLIDRRQEIVDAGRKHLSQTVQAGRSAYRDAHQVTSTPPVSSLAAIGILVFEAAALAAGYRLSAGLQTQIRRVEPHLKTLLDSSETALAEGSRQITAVTSTVHRFLDVFETVAEALSKPSV